MAVADILVSPATVYYAAVGTALPDETSVAYEGTWSSWTSLGTTLEPVTLAVEVEDFEVELQQHTAAVKRTRSKEAITIETVLAEFTGANLAVALDGTNTDTAAGAAQKAFSEIKMGGDFDIGEKTWAFEGYRVDTAGTKQPVRVHLLKGTAMFNGSLQFAKGAAVGIPLQIKALANTAGTVGQRLMTIHVVTAPVTA